MGRATGPLAGSEARRLRPLNVLVKPELTRSWPGPLGGGRGQRDVVEEVLLSVSRGESASGRASLPDTGGVVPEGESPAHRVLLRRNGSAEDALTGRAVRLILPGRSPTARILVHAGFLVVRREGWHGFVSANRGLVNSALNSLPPRLLAAPRERHAARRNRRERKSHRSIRQIDRGRRVRQPSGRKATTSR